MAAKKFRGTLFCEGSEIPETRNLPKSTTSTPGGQADDAHSFYVTVTEKLDPGLSPEDARGDVLSLLTWHPLPTSAEIMEGAWSIQDRFGLSWWDSLIVSAGRLADCRYLLTEDLQANQMFGDIQVINPFMRSPNSLGQSLMGA